jgi:hypothetical protein
LRTFHVLFEPDKSHTSDTLQRYAIDACEKLGYDAAARALRSELRTLLSDMADLPKRTLLDDTGTANPDTLLWLQENLSS